ncbi:MAG: hypothetical protein A2Z96_02830 [Spirochaetes bacterium GWB1_48_6]|nr:MAG: hypothetical protein A2Z96_02830 [Spirochaetes bacterium GWB1_48_6]
MGIAFIIVGGLTLISIVAMVGDYLTKTKMATLSTNPQTIGKLEQRIENLEKQLQEQDHKISHLEQDISFTSKLLEKKA